MFFVYNVYKTLNSAEIGAHYCTFIPRRILAVGKWVNKWKTIKTENLKINIFIICSQNTDANDKREIKNAHFMLRLQIVIYDGIWYISM